MASANLESTMTGYSGLSPFSVENLALHPEFHSGRFSLAPLP
jgi:hypothetical protein